ncbi:hypothetical protein D9619_000282 [Psilocybe cf. subviscida]|uniref:Uncharacterized protein n=1 Tax=Psilocybe cf. subviscida TaxID=2480587 RepID=A0A8H5BDZ7_9AGAR|nr:hypothetical protein D9619_000282 [Psilocybe cf. subviscida]
MSTSEPLRQWPLLQGIMALTLVSTALYTLNVALAFSCVRQLFAQKTNFTSKRRLTVSCAYCIALVAVASEATIRLNIDMINTIKQLLLAPNHDIRDFPTYPLSLPFAVWGADGILMWRCIILYQFASRPKRIGIYFVLGFLCLSSLACGIVNLSSDLIAGTNTPDSISGNANGTYAVAYDSVTTSFDRGVLLVPAATLGANGTLVVLIAARLVYAHWVLSAAQSDILRSSNRKQSGPYLTAMAICVESSAIILVAAALSFIYILLPDNESPGLRNSWFQPVILLTQLCVLSPLLIIYRVSRGRSDDTITRLEETLVFHHTQHSAVSQSDIDGI